MTRFARMLSLAAAASLLTLPATTSLAHDGSDPTCVQGGRQNPDIVARRAALKKTPTMLGKRMELAKLLQKAGCYDDAMHLLEDGQKYNPLSPILLLSLRRARNLAGEEHYLEGVERAEATARLNKNMQRIKESTVHDEPPAQLAANSAAAEAMAPPPTFSNAAEATRSN
jgi:hypothetical protein